MPQKRDRILDTIGASVDPSPKPDAQAACQRRRLVLLSALVLLCVIVGLVFGLRPYAFMLAAIADKMRRAAWLLPFLILLHLLQLLLSAFAWRCLLPGTAVPPGLFYRLRIAREGIDSLLPVAQVGGEIVGARLLARNGETMGRAAASVILDVTLEVLTQLLFLLAGLATLFMIGETLAGASWVKLVIAGAFTGFGCVITQRLGLLRVLEAITQGIGRRWPSLAGVSLTGLHDAALDLYRRRTPLLGGVALHLPAWFLGSLESWAVLRAIGIKAGFAQALVVESLGMAGRSAGFAIPAAIGAQESGFILAAAAAGIAASPALALCLVKRVREVAVGAIGLALWRLELGRAVPLQA